MPPWLQRAESLKRLRDRAPSQGACYPAVYSVGDEAAGSEGCCTECRILFLSLARIRQPYCLDGTIASVASRRMPAEIGPQHRLRVAIVGLVHDHVAGFLAQLPQHHDVELVGIAEPDPGAAGEIPEEVLAAPTISSLKTSAKMIERAVPRRCWSTPPSPIIAA